VILLRQKNGEALPASGMLDSPLHVETIGDLSERRRYSLAIIRETRQIEHHPHKKATSRRRGAVLAGVDDIGAAPE
jgi:hypothetical protein